MTEGARAVVPGHVTGFFTVDRRDDPTESGSRGAGLALSDGVTVTVRREGAAGLWLNGEAVEMGAVRRVLEALEASGATVEAETELPLSAGFGVSGATALGTALAVNRAYGRRLSVNELVTVAHGAEVQADTGLGDVVAQARGGAPIRLEPGGPHEHVLDRVPASTAVRVEYEVLGDLATEEVVTGDTETLTAAGEQALSELVQEPTLSTFMEASRGFAREAGLLTEDVRAVVEDVAEAGGSATMGMLGETVVALGTGLTDAGYDPAVCRLDHAGARLER